MAKTVFEQNFRHNLKRVDKRLDAYIKDQDNDENIRGVRTALRRLDAAFSLLPKKLRKRNHKKMEKYRKFFKANSKIRDYDMISTRLAALHASDVGDALKRKRKAELARALKLAKSLKRTAPMKVDGIPDDKFRARTDMLTDRLAGSIKELLPAVLSDSSKVKELHRLRKDCKTLRYILEVAPADSKEKYAKVIRGKDLEKMQHLLGAAHDSDVTIEFLKNTNSRLAKKEAGNRRQLYLAFVRYMKK